MQTIKLDMALLTRESMVYFHWSCDASDVRLPAGVFPRVVEVAHPSFGVGVGSRSLELPLDGVRPDGTHVYRRDGVQVRIFND